MRRMGLMVPSTCETCVTATSLVLGPISFSNSSSRSSPASLMVHKTTNVLPKIVQSKAKTALQNIWMAETRKDAEVSFDHFIELYEAKYNKAVGCLKKGRDALLAFYDFPAEHWETFADHESDRKYVRDRPSSNHPLEG